MIDELMGAWKELQEYPGEEISVADAVPVVARATGLRIHLLRDDEVVPALEHAKRMIVAERVHRGPYEVKNEIVKASREKWTGLSQQARIIVAALWAERIGADMVMTSVDPVQSKEKILATVEHILEQKKRFPLGQNETST